MSKIALEGNVSGSGTLTIAAPNTNSNFTLSLPTNTGTIITQNSTPAFASTIGVGGATAAASGAGITFPATASASSDANTLDDYEEGTWTPILVPQSGAFTSVTYDPARSGRYTKIGNTVFLQGAMRTDAITVGTASGEIYIGGLPFIVNSAAPSAAVNVAYALAFAGDMPDGGLAAPNTDYVFLFYRTSANGASIVLNVTDLGTGTNANYVIFEGFYAVA